MFSVSVLWTSAITAITPRLAQRPARADAKEDRYHSRHRRLVGRVAALAEWPLAAWRRSSRRKTTLQHALAPRIYTLSRSLTLTLHFGAMEGLLQGMHCTGSLLLLAAGIAAAAPPPTVGGAFDCRGGAVLAVRFCRGDRGVEGHVNGCSGGGDPACPSLPPLGVLTCPPALPLPLPLPLKHKPTCIVRVHLPVHCSVHAQPAAAQQGATRCGRQPQAGLHKAAAGNLERAATAVQGSTGSGKRRRPGPGDAHRKEGSKARQGIKQHAGRKPSQGHATAPVSERQGGSSRGPGRPRRRRRGGPTLGRTPTCSGVVQGEEEAVSR